MAIRIKHSNNGAEISSDSEEHDLSLLRPLTLAERLAFEAELEQPPTPAQRRAALAGYLSQEKRQSDAAFLTFLQYGMRALTPELRAQTTTSSGGGYLIQAAYEKQFIAAMKQNDPILDIATTFETPTGAAGDYPIDDDTVVGAIVAESGTSTAGDVTYSSLPLQKVPQHRSNMIRVPLELLQDAFTTYDNLISPVLARRLARSVAATAIAKLLTDAEVGVTSAAPGVVVGSEILDLMASVDPAHSRVGVFLMNETTLTMLKKLTANTAGNFLSMIGTDAQGRTTLFGKTAYSSPSMPAATAMLKPIAFGNFSRFYLRSVLGSLVLKRYDERYAEYAQVGFEMFWRAIGALAKSTNTPTPVKVLAMHA